MAVREQMEETKLKHLLLVFYLHPRAEINNLIFSPSKGLQTILLSVWHGLSGVKLPTKQDYLLPLS